MGKIILAKVKLIIVDDHKLVRETWAYVLDCEPSFEVVGDFGDSASAIAACIVKKPDVVLMDINIAPMSGFEATARLLELIPTVKVLAVSMHTDPAYTKKMFESGALGYITKNSTKEEMIKAILAVYNNTRYVCDVIKEKITFSMLSDAKPSIGLKKLSDREKEIIQLIKLGNSSKEMAIILNLSVKTIEVHRHNILRKLDLKNAAALIN